MKAPSLAAIAAFAALQGAAIAVPARAAEPAYLDDRSDAASLVRSLYNAVSRQEYARAWSYFGETKPAADFDAFVEGYSDTARVDVETGPIGEEGAAGSVYFSVPTAIRATGKDGGERVFAGCYTLRMANAQVQGEPFTPLHIEKAVLKPAEGDLASAVPPQCGSAPAPEPRDPTLEKATKAFRAAYGESCGTLAADAKEDAATPTVGEISYRPEGASESDPALTARLYGFPCDVAAYNSQEVYYLAQGAGEVTQVQFAVPDLQIAYENGDHEGKVEQVTIIGSVVDDRLANSSFDPATLSLTSHAKWRGAGDAATSGKWIFRGGRFTLVRYEVDASYDGEINPETVVDYDTPP